MVSLILWGLAALLNAVMDILKFHFEFSIFKNKDPKWWNPNISWGYVMYIKHTKYRPDAWHLYKSGMIIFIAAAIALAMYYPAPEITKIKFIDITFYFVILGIEWNLIFNTFYNRILRRYPQN